MKDLKIKAVTVGVGLGLYLDKVLKLVLGIEKGDVFTVEMKTVKGVKTIILREVEK